MVAGNAVSCFFANLVFFKPMQLDVPFYYFSLFLIYYSHEQPETRTDHNGIILELNKRRGGRYRKFPECISITSPTRYY